MAENNILQGPPYDLSQIYKEEILFKLANNFPADFYFFIWRCCEEKVNLRFKFTLSEYFDSKFQMRAVIYLSRLGLVNPINWDGPHVGIENLVASDIKISKEGKILFQKWIKKGLVHIIIDLPHEIRRNIRTFNNYFCNNFKFSKELEKRRNEISRIEVVDYEDFYLLNGPKEHEIKICVEYRQKLITGTIKEEIRFVSALISCGFCEKGFIFTIKPKTFSQYITSKKTIRRGCPNCKYPHFRTRFSLFFYNNKFCFERYLTERDKEILFNQKQREKKKILRRFTIFISNTILNPSEKKLDIRTFEIELEEKWDEIKGEHLLFNEFQEALKEFYLEKKSEIKESLQ